MQNKRALAALRRVAEENGVPLETVIAEIEQLIRACTKSEDPDIRRQWAAIPCAGEVPAPLELMEYLMMQVQQHRGGR